MSKKPDQPGKVKYSSKGSVSNYTDMVISEEEYGVSFSQQCQIQKLIKEDIRSFLFDVVHPVTKNPNLDNRSAEYKNIQKYAAKVKRESFFYELNPEQLDFIGKNHKRMRPTEMTLTLFPEIAKKNVAGTREGKCIAKYTKAIERRDLKSSIKGKKLLEQFEDPTQLEIDLDFVPPKNFKDLCTVINNSDINASYNPDQLSKEQKKNLNSLKGYLQSTRFMITMDSAPTTLYKKIVFNEYVRATYDKNDLTADELNGYITLCDSYGQETQAKKHLILLNDALETGADDDDPKLRMGLIEAISSKTSELNNISKQQQTLQEKLSGTRIKRLETQTEIGESLILFVDKWKEEEYRKTNMRIHEARKLELSKEKKRFENYDDLIAEVIGVEEEIILDV